MSAQFEAAHQRMAQWRAVITLCTEINGRRARDGEPGVRCHNLWTDTLDALLGFSIRLDAQGSGRASGDAERALAHIRADGDCFEADLARVRAGLLDASDATAPSASVAAH